MYIDGTGIPHVVVSPHIMEQLIASEDGPAIAHQVRQEVELLGLQFEFFAPAIDTPTGKINA